MPFKEGDFPINEPVADILSSAEREKLSQENYYFSQDAAWEEFKKLSLNPEEAVAWFDEKYQEYGDTPIRLRDRNGNLLEERQLEEISPEEKQEHSWGRLKMINDDYNLNFIKHFFNEPELLKIADKKLSNLKRLVELYKINSKKLGER